MEISDEDKHRLAEEIASWNDISNWTFVPKSLLKHVFGAEGKAGAVYEAIGKLNQDSSNVPPHASPLPSLVEVTKIVEEAKRDMDQKRLLFMYFHEHMDALVQKATTELVLDFLKQLRAKVPERDFASTISQLVEAKNSQI